MCPSVSPHSLTRKEGWGTPISPHLWGHGRSQKALPRGSSESSSSLDISLSGPHANHGKASTFLSTENNLCLDIIIQMPAQTGKPNSKIDLKNKSSLIGRWSVIFHPFCESVLLSPQACRLEGAAQMVDFVSRCWRANSLAEIGECQPLP
ncbi:hypothetical protein SKAU_G00336910 [Synaphobranchus kaupii]|uniref:Uncharacterized protein n=1 Tax=Synaphobranchus kaupii TaxID=118154 RepID=A0A9Q1II53_SYNKA|nr:hypothetical protein SKAU_G00336910 [Synaphobranchus kaupii]